jgi:hypothetical protein
MASLIIAMLLSKESVFPAPAAAGSPKGYFFFFRALPHTDY